MKKYFLITVSILGFLAAFLMLPKAICSASILDQVAPSAQNEMKISLDLKGIDLVEALKILSSKGNMNMVIGGNIEGRVTLFLKDVDILDALEIILITNNLAYDKKGDIYYVMTQSEYEQRYGESYTASKKTVKILPIKYAKAGDLAKSMEQVKSRFGRVVVDDASNSLVLMDNEDSMAQMLSIIEKIDKKPETRVFQLKYAKATDLKDRITEQLTKDTGSSKVDERTNKIVVTDIGSKLDQIAAVIEAFDERPLQVLIEAKIVQVTLSNEYRLGVNWENIFNAITRDVSITNKFALTTSGALNPGTEVVVGHFGQGQYAMMMQALETVGDTNLLSSPRITAINNQEAKILVGESRPYATNAVTQSTGTATTATSLSFLDIGVKLYVTPSISKDGFVTMKIKPEVSSTTSNYTYGDPATTVPIVSTTQAETSVTVKDGNTIIIAGLIKDERSKDETRTPIFADIPGLGFLFKNTDNLTSKQELVIFLTTHIVSGAENYLEIPKTPPIGENRFTITEQETGFKRKEPKLTDPTFFKKPEVDEEGYAESVIKKVSAPANAQEYFYRVKDKVLSNIQLRETETALSGKLKIVFVLSREGQLLSEPAVESSSSPELENVAIEAVKYASPFPSFPDEMQQDQKEFNMEFVFE